MRGSSPWVQKGFPEEYLNRLESKETAAKIKNAANDYFNVQAFAFNTSATLWADNAGNVFAGHLIG